MPDFTAIDCGTIIALRPQADAAREWCDRHLPDDASWFGGAVAIEPRYFPPIAEAIEADGLSFGDDA